MTRQYNKQNIFIFIFFLWAIVIGVLIKQMVDFWQLLLAISQVQQQSLNTILQSENIISHMSSLERKDVWV